MPDDLQRLLAAVLASIGDHNAALSAGRISVDAWQRLTATDLLTSHYASYMVGKGSKDLSDREQRVINGVVGGHLDYLNLFADAIEASGWKESYGARALLYGAGVKESYWRGKTSTISLGFYPGDGSTACLSNCACSLDMEWLDEEELDVDVHWRVGSTEHCDGCIARAAASPYQFRGGERL